MPLDAKKIGAKSLKHQNAYEDLPLTTGPGSPRPPLVSLALCPNFLLVPKCTKFCLTVGLPWMSLALARTCHPPLAPLLTSTHPSPFVYMPQKCLSSTPGLN